MQPIVGMLTHGERAGLLADTIKSLARAGMPSVRVYCDTVKKGQAAPFLRALQWWLDCVPGDGWVLAVEDDIAVPVGFGNYLDPILDRLEPHRERLGFATLFCGRGFRQWLESHPVSGVPSFGALVPSDLYSGNQCLLFPAGSLAALLPLMRTKHAAHPKWGGDRLLGWAAAESRLEAWCHYPSLADHRGLHHSTVCSNTDDSAIIASDYVGDDWRHP